MIPEEPWGAMRNHEDPYKGTPFFNSFKLFFSKRDWKSNKGTSNAKAPIVTCLQLISLVYYRLSELKKNLNYATLKNYFNKRLIHWFLLEDNFSRIETKKIFAFVLAESLIDMTSSCFKSCCKQFSYVDMFKPCKVFKTFFSCNFFLQFFIICCVSLGT